MGTLGPWIGGRQAPEENPQGKTTKTPAGTVLRILVPDGSQANLAPVVSAFKERHPGLTIDLQSCGVDDVATEMTLRSLAGSADFDVALPATFSLADLAEAGVIQPLDPLLPAAESPAARSLYSLGDRYKGTTYGLQTDGDVYLMFYNRALLEDEESRTRFSDRFQRELSIPHTWEELDQTMEFFHAPEKKQYGGALFRSPSYLAWEFWIRLHAKGIFPVDNEMRPQLNQPEGVAAAEELIRASEWLSPGAESAGLVDNWKTFSAGQTFCNIGWGGSQKYFRRPDSPIRDSVVTELTPGGNFGGDLGGPPGGKPTRLSYFNWGWNFTVSTFTSQAKLAAEFALFATTGQAALESVRAQDGFFDPFLEAHYSDAAITETYTQPFLEKHRAAMAAAIPDFYMAGREEYFDLLGRFLARANAGKLSPKDALTIVAKGWDLITDRRGRDSQIAQWQFLKSRYPDPIRRALRPA